MGKIEVDVDVNAPLEKVFDVFTDFMHAAERVEGITKLEVLTNGPIGKGTKFRETRVMMGKESTEEMEITDFQPNESLRVEANSCGAHYQTDYTFHQNGDSTNVKMSFEGKPVSFAAKLMSPMFLLMAKTVRKCLIDDMTCLKRFAESDE